MKPCSYAHLIFDNGTQTCNGGKTASSINMGGRIGYLPGEVKQDLCLSPCTNVNSKWIKGLNIKPETFN
jgi:hypothetical protein